MSDLNTKLQTAISDMLLCFKDLLMPKKRAHKANNKPRRSTEPSACFVIMPFGGWLDDYYEAIYKPAIKAAGLVGHRADDLFRPSTIVNDIWTYTKIAKLLIADLTGKNANVFYELGLAHALGKPVILVAESMEDIPFDLRALRIILYDKNDPEWGSLLKEKIQASIKEVVKSPIEAVLPAFLDVKPSVVKPAVSDRDLSLIEMKQELDLLRRELRSKPPAGSAERDIIDADEARALVRSYLLRHVPEPLIVEKLTPLGPPPSWIRQEIKIALATMTKARPRSTRKPTLTGPTRLEARSSPPQGGLAAGPA